MMKLSNICKSIAAVFVAASASLAVEVWDGSVAESFAEGKGTVAEPYKISNGAELALFAQRVSVKGDTTLNAVLTNDIYLNENSEEYEKWGETPPANKWVTPIGGVGHSFQGSFDGKGNKVYGVYMDTSLVVGDYLGYGFFGNASDSSKIRNLGVEHSYISIGWNWDGTKVTHSAQVGVLAGRVQGAALTNISANGVVKVDAVNGTTAAKYSEIGCVVGYATAKAALVNAVANCSMSSSMKANSTGAVYHSLGGVVGKTSTNIFVQNVFGLSSVRDASLHAATGSYIGGVVGYQAQKTDTLYNAYYNISTIGSENAPTAAIGSAVGVSKNVSSRTTSKMKSEEFAALLGPAFTYTATKNDGYPFPVVFEGAAAFDGGDGSEASPYLIGSAKALRAVSGLVNGMNAEFGGKSYKMTADVELNEDSETYKSWETTPPEFSWFQIGREYHRKDTVSADCGGYDAGLCSQNFFKGVFDGGHHVVKGLFISDTTNQSQGGLFLAAVNAIIKNLGVENSFVSVKGRAAGILGIGTFVTIDSCHNGAEIRSFSQDNGGIAGELSNSVLSNCYNTGNLKTVSNKRSAWSNGGIVGEMFRGSTVSNSWNSGNVIAVQASAGGIIGCLDSSNVLNVYNAGNVSADSVVGGVVGALRYSSTLENAYSIGTVSAKVAAKRGGVVGQMTERTSPKVRNTISDSYYNSQTIGSTNAPTAAIGTVAGSVTNVSALPTASMTTGRFAVMLGSAYKQDDNVNNGYPTFLAAGESFGVLDLFEGGDGSEGNPFLIATATQLRNMEYLVNKKNAEYGNKHYKLVADISLNENSADYLSWEKTAPANTWTPMGVNEANSFKGTFDGGSHTVSGLYTNARFSGLFGVVENPAIVKNLIVKESFERTGDKLGTVGAIVGYCKKGSLDNLHNEGDVYGLYLANVGYDSVSAVGGVVGRMEGGMLKNISNKGSVKGWGTAIKSKISIKSSDEIGLSVGGIVGKASFVTIDSAINYGFVDGRSTSMDSVWSKVAVGGVVGNVNSAIIRDSRNEGTLYVKGTDSSKVAPSWPRAGGVAGAAVSTNSKTIILRCENRGALTGYVNSGYGKSTSGVAVGGILGRSGNGLGTIIENSVNSGDITTTGKYSLTLNAVAGIVAYVDNVISVENSYASGKYMLTTTATANTKVSTNWVGGIAGNVTSNGLVKGSYFYGTVSSTASGTTVTNYKGGIVAYNDAPVIGSYFDSEVAGVTDAVGKAYSSKSILTKSKALTTAEMQTNEFAWLLNTLGGDSTNSNVFTRYNSYPEFATDDQLPIYRVVFDDEVDIKNLYTSYKGFISAPANPEPAPGEMFVGWTDGDKYMLQNRQVINKDMTLYALFTLLTKPIYKITFMDGDEVLVKVTENDGKIANFPVAKNIPMGYHFDGWYDNTTNKAVEEDMAFTGTATLIAKFSANLYKITFLDYDGSEISSEDVAYGTTPKAPKVTRESTEDFSYTLKGWTPDIDVVVGDASYTAVYDSTKIESSSSEEQSSSSSSSIEESSSCSEEESSSSEEVSSSSEEDSSSSAKSSSSSAKSSSSSAKSSSSSAKSSSSSAKSSSSSAKSSSSSAKSSSSSAKSSSSKGDDKDAIYTIAQVPQFNISVAGRTLQIAGAQANSKVTVFDLRGNVMYAGFAYATNFSIEMPRSGSYLVRIGNQTQRVNVK